MDSYRKHQVSLIESYSRLQFEYSSLVQQAGFSEKDVEVQVHKKVKQFLVFFYRFGKIQAFFTVHELKNACFLTVEEWPSKFFN